MDEVLDDTTMDNIEVEGDFVGEIWMSTDGKHTVHSKANTPEARKEAFVWTKKVYDFLIEKYGTKQRQAKLEYSGETDLGTCTKCGAKNLMSRRGKPYCSAKCWLNEEKDYGVPTDE